MKLTKIRILACLARARDERGATATEYGVLMGFIAMIIVAGIGVFGTSVNAWFAQLAASVADILT